MQTDSNSQKPATNYVSKIKNEWKGNWKSALSVALVNIPMSLALAIASGAGPSAGIITAIWAGIVAAMLGGSHYNIAGPAGALSGILAAYALMYGPGILPLVALVSGVVVIIVWALKWDKYIVFIPSSVVHGFTLSVAFTIGLGQINSALGLKGLAKHEKLLENVWESLKHLDVAHVPTFIVFAVGLALMFALLKYRPTWPNSVIVSLLGIGLGLLNSAGWYPYALETIQTKYGLISLSLFNTSHLVASSFNATLFKAVPLVAIIIVLETLLSAKVADGMTKTKFRQNKEVFGIGIANIMSGIFGGLPATGVFARTALNIRSGAKSKYSAIFNGVIVILLSFVFLKWFSYLPLATVASILIFLSFRMVGTHHFKNLYKFDKTAFGIALAVAFLSIAYDPLVGILAGSAVSLMIFVNYISKAQCDLVVGKLADGEDADASDIAQYNDGRDSGIPGAYMKRVTSRDLDLEKVSADILIYRFVGELNYMNSQRYIELTHKINGNKNIILNFKNLFYIDVDGLDALDEIIEELELRGKTIYLSGISRYLQPLFLKKSWYEKKGNAGYVVGSTKEAVMKIKQS